MRPLLPRRALSLFRALFWSILEALDTYCHFCAAMSPCFTFWLLTCSFLCSSCSVALPDALSLGLSTTPASHFFFQLQQIYTEATMYYVASKEGILKAFVSGEVKRSKHEAEAVEAR